MRSALLLVTVTACSFPRPADVPDFDASANDAVIDALASNDGAMPDAMSPAPLVTGQLADLVLGQPDFDQTMDNNGGVSSRSLFYPKDVWSEGTHLCVADLGNRRVLQWNSLPDIGFGISDVAIGQANMTDTQATVDEYKLGGGSLAGLVTNARMGGDTFGAKVFVADPAYSRVLIWIPIPSASGAKSSVVLGSPFFTPSSTPPANPPSASTLANCSAVWSDGTRVAVADTTNNRVLLWNSIPSINGQAADVVLGQPTFTTNSTGSATASSMYLPMGVFFDGTHLFVADAGNNRVMVWNGWPSQQGKAADYFIGQATGTSVQPDVGANGTNEVGLDHPTDVLVANGALFIDDMGNNRVVMHYPIPTTSGTKAKAVVGQAGFSTNATAATAGGMSNPQGIGAAAGYLWVADTGNHRVLRFTLKTP